MENFTAHGYLTISNHGGVEIELSPCGDGLRYMWFDREPEEAEILYDKNGEAYFKIGKTRFYLSEFMKTTF
jgi:hypothetical protein